MCTLYNANRKPRYTTNLTMEESETTEQLFQSEDLKRLLKETLQTISEIVYNDMYPYIWFICIYHVFLIFITTVSLVMILRKR